MNYIELANEGEWDFLKIFHHLAYVSKILLAFDSNV